MKHIYKEYEQLGMTQGFTELYNFYTSREHLRYQKLHFEYPCSVDGTKPYRLHTRLFYHQLSLIIDKNNEFSLLNMLYTGGISLSIGKRVNLKHLAK